MQGRKLLLFFKFASSKFCTFLYGDSQCLESCLKLFLPRINFLQSRYSRCCYFCYHLTKMYQKFVIIFSFYLIILFRSSRLSLFLGKDALNISSKFKGKHSYRNAISIKLFCNIIEITLRHGCVPVNMLLFIYLFIYNFI